MRIALAFALLVAGTLGACAQAAIDARCLKAKDPAGCTCALAFGGTIENGIWAPPRGADKRAIEACAAERGGTAKARPAIPGRL